MITLDCPMPQLEFDVITLGHGSGGILTNQLLESGVFDLLKNPLLDEHHDGAIFEWSGRTAFSADSYVISPIFFPGGNIGELAVHGTVNDLAMCGAVPQYLSLSFILEEGLTMKEFWEILVSIRRAAEKAEVSIVTGDTKVVERGKGDKIFINTSGLGKIHPQAHISTKNIRVGDKIIVSGPIATHGIAIMSVREGLEFETTLTSDSAPLNHTVKALLDEFGMDIHLLKDPTRGGVASVLNEVARDSRLGVNLFQQPIPVLDEVRGACELLGLDPLYVANEGVFMTFVSAKRAEEFVQKLQTLEYGQHAAIIGEITAEHPKQVVLHSRIGGKRVVNMLVGEQLPRIC
jgi:hydrogenase expression/formation protein HypE